MNRFFVVSLALVACNIESADPTQGSSVLDEFVATGELTEPAPPPTLSLTVPAEVTNAYGRVVVSGAAAGQMVYLVGGQFGAGPCHPAGGCLGIRPPTLIGSGIANGNGVAPIQFDPAGGAFDELSLQAVQLAGGVALSEVETVLLEPDTAPNMDFVWFGWEGEAVINAEYTGTEEFRIETSYGEALCSWNTVVRDWESVTTQPDIFEDAHAACTNCAWSFTVTLTGHTETTPAGSCDAMGNPVPVSSPEGYGYAWDTQTSEMLYYGPYSGGVWVSGANAGSMRTNGHLEYRWTAGYAYY